MILSAHIPKTGGVTFRNYLLKAFNNEVVFHYGEKKYRKTKKKTNHIPPEAKVIHGHIPINRYLPEYPNAKTIIWLRHPIQIPPSMYYYFKRNPDPHNPDCVTLHKKKMTLTQFVEYIDDWNLIALHMAGKKPSEFTFIGITEKYELSMKLFQKTFKLNTNYTIQHDNTNPQKPITSTYSLNPQELNLIQSRCYDDIQLYNQSLKIFKKKIKKITKNHF